MKANLKQRPLVLLCGLALLGSACSTQPPAATSGISEQIGRIEQQLQQLTAKLDEPSGRKYRDQIEGFQTELLSGNGDVAKIAGELSKVRNSLTALAAIELSTPIAVVDWLVEMESLLSDDQNAESLSEAELLLEQIPEAIGPETAQKYASRHAKNVIALCQAMSSAKQPDGEALALASEMLGRLESDEQRDPAVEKLKSTLDSKANELRSAALANAVKADLAVLESQLTKALAIKELELKNSVLIALNQSLDNLRSQLVLEGRPAELAATQNTKDKLRTNLDKTFEEISNRQQAAVKQARMQYQAWALQELEKLNPLINKASIDKELYRLRDNAATSAEPIVIRWLDFKGVRELFEKSLGAIPNKRQLDGLQQSKVGPFVKDNWSEITYQLKHDAAVRHLLHIDQGMLDPPVAKFYGEAFESVWKGLQDRTSLQVSLARMSAEVPKRGLETFMKGQ